MSKPMTLLKERRLQWWLFFPAWIIPMAMPLTKILPYTGAGDGSMGREMLIVSLLIAKSDHRSMQRFLCHPFGVRTFMFAFAIIMSPLRGLIYQMTEYVEQGGGHESSDVHWFHTIDRHHGFCWRKYPGLPDSFNRQKATRNQFIRPLIISSLTFLIVRNHISLSFLRSSPEGAK